MKFDLITGILIVMALVLTGPDSLCQRVIVNSNGERIIMFPDGSWRLAEAGDSVLIRSNLQKSEALGQDNENLYAEQSRTPGEFEEYILKQWNELHFNIKALEKKIQNEFRAATNAQFSASEIYHNAEANKALIEPDRFAQISENYEQSIKKLKQAKLNQNTIKKLFEESRKMANLEPKKMEKKLNTLRSKFNLFVADYDPSKSLNTPAEVKIAKNKTTLPKNKTSKESKQPREKNTSPDDATTVQVSSSINSSILAKTTPYKSEPFRCRVEMDTIDQITGSRRIALEPGLIFTHTDPDLRPFFKNKELITCYGKLSKIGAYVYLEIDFQIASSHSQSNFGSLQNGSLLRLRLLNGEYVSLYNVKSDRGHIDPYSGYTIFNGQYVLGKDEIKMLQSTELDKIRILWSTGYEDYDVYKVDFFIDQLNCLMNR